MKAPRFAVSATAALALLAATAAAAPAPKTVLVLEQETFAWPAPQAFIATLREELRRDGVGPLVLYEESLDLSRFADGAYEAGLGDWLREKYRDRPIDVIVAGGQRTLRFVLTYGQQIWPDAQLVAAGIDAGVLASLAPPGRVTGRTRIVPVGPTLELALTLFPQTRRVAIVAGQPTSAYSTDRVTAAKDFAAAHGLAVLELAGLPMAALERRVATLPDDAVIFYAGIIRDGDGQLFVPRDALAIVARAANRPIFSDVETHLGAGNIGGFLLAPAAHGAETAAIVRRLLRGERVADIPLAPSEASFPGFDWRELERWNVRVPLPPGSVVAFREPTLWERYRAWVLAAGTIVALQGVLIAGLLIERRARRRAELEAQQHLQQLAHVDRVAALGELATVLAHEINQPLAAILGNAQAARRLLAAATPDLVEVRDSLDDIVADDKRAADVISRMRALLRTGEPRREPVRLNGLVREVIGLVAGSAGQRHVALDTELASGLPVVSGDPVQLQQVILNLLANGIDAAADGEGPRRVLVRTAADGRDVELSVHDSGRGLPRAQRERVFEPFLTSKGDGLGVGLAITRSIVEAHGGRIWAEDASGTGATFRCRLPAGERAG